MVAHLESASRRPDLETGRRQPRDRRNRQWSHLMSPLAMLSSEWHSPPPPHAGEFDQDLERFGTARSNRDTSHLPAVRRSPRPWFSSSSP